MMRLPPWFITVALICLAAAELQAQPKPGYAPSATHIFPAGGRRGTTVAVQVGTECAPPQTRFWLSGAGVRAPQVLGDRVTGGGEPSPRRAPTEIPITYPRQWESQLTIEDEAPLGVVFWQLSCAQGGSVSRPFVVGDLPEKIEAESNSLPATAETIELPVTVNGQIDGERDVDYFRFTARGGETISCEMVARRLGSALDPLMELVDGDGRALPADSAYLGNDPVLVFRAPADGAYLLRVANVTWHGSPACVYRVNLTRRPLALYAFPGGGPAGGEVPLEVLALTGAGLESFPATVAFPAQVGPFDYRDPRTSGAVRLECDGGPGVLESEANNARPAAQAVSLPATIEGRFLDASDEDWFQFAAEAGVRYELRCGAVPRSGPCRPTLTLSDAQGNSLATARSVETADGVAVIGWRAAQSGTYFLRVRDLRHAVAGGAQFVYRLSIRPAQPDFALQLAADNVNVVPGGQIQLDVSLLRTGGFEGPVQLRLEGLPAGVTVDGDQVPAQKSSAKIKLSVGDDVPVGRSTVQLIGSAQIAGETIERTALAAHQGVDSEGVSVGPARLPQLQLTVCHKPVFRLYCAEAYQYAHRGSVYPYLMEIERLDGFDGEIVLQRGDRQNRDLDGVEMLETVVAPGESQVLLPIYLPETMHINVQSQSQLYSQAYAIFTDRAGVRQSVLVLSEKRNMLRTLPPVVKLQAADEQLRAAPGETVACRLRVQRTTNFAGPMQLQLVEPAGVLAVQPASIPAGGSEVTVKLVVPAGQAAGPLDLKFRATGTLAADTLVISEAALRLVVTD